MNSTHTVRHIADTWGVFALPAALLGRRMLRWILTALGVLGAFAQPAQVAAQSSPAAFNPLVTVSNTAAQVSDLAAVTLDGSTIYVVWREEPASGQQIRLRRSTNGGVSFIDGTSGRVVASVDPAETVYTVRVAAAGPIVYVLYTSGVEPRLAKARLARSADGGETFAPPMALAGTLQYGGTSSADLAVDGTGVVHVVIEDRDVSDDIHYLFSTDAGVTFSAPAALASSPGPSVRPRVAAKGSRIAIVWEELSTGTAGSPAGDIAFIYSIDAGASFGAVRNLSATAADSNRPAVAVGNAIQVVWTEGNSVALRSSPDGAAFTAAAQIGVAPAGETIAGAAVGSALGTVHVSWTTVNADGVMNGPFYRRSTDGAGTFAATQDLRFGLAGAPFGLPAIASGTAARIVWPHSASGFAVDADVLFAGQANCGISWAAPVSGNWNDPTKWSPAVVPSVGSSACITVEGAPYIVTVAGNQNAGELTIGHATSDVRPTVHVTGSLTVGTSVVNSGELILGGPITSATGVIVNSERGRLSTAAGAPGAINGSAINYGEVDLSANLTILGNLRTFTNFGSFTIRPGAATPFGGSFVFNQNGGVLKVEGTMEFSAEFNTAGDTMNFNGGVVDGTVIIQGHSRLNIGPGSEGAGTFQFERNAIFGISANATLTGNTAPAQTLRLITQPGAHSASVVAANGFTNAGTLVMDAASLVVTAGTLVNTGTIAVDATSPVVGRAIDANIDNRGTFTVGADLSLRGANRTFTNTGTVRVFVGATVLLGSTAVFNQQAGLLDVGGALVLNTEFNTSPDTFNLNGGHIDGAAGVHLRSTSRLNIAPGAADSRGRFVYRAPGGGTMSGNLGPQMTLLIQGSSVTAANGLTNAGTIVLAVESSPTQGASLAVTTGTLVNTGTITVEPTASGTPLNAVVENHGRITINDTITLSRANANHINRGVVEIASGNIVTLMGNSTLRNLAPGGFGGAGTLSIANGSTFTAAGALAINVTNAGRFRPGASPGVVNITGRYTQTPTGWLEIEIAGAAAGSGFDQVNVGGGATLAGTLDVQVAAGFCIEGSYPFLTYAVVAGDFPTRLGLTASGGRSLVPSQGATAYALNASGPPCNEAPVATADSYSTDEGTPLSAAAPGVLGNDTDAQGDALTAIIAAGPTNGTLTLNPNGSFTYTPNPGFSGTDGFTYRASDGTAQSGVAAVTISVLATAPPVITSFTPNRLTVGLVRALRVSGAHFSAPTITLRKGDLEVRGNVLVSTPTTIHAEFDVTSVPPGNWTVVVENQNGKRVDAPIFVQPAIIIVTFFFDGVRAFPIGPAGRVSGRARANYLTVMNVGLADGMVPVTIDLPHPRMRLKVGAHSEPMHTGGSVTFLVWAPVGVEVRVPLYWGISPEDINFPGEPPDPSKPTFGQTLSFQVHASIGLTAGSGQVTEMLVRMFGGLVHHDGLPIDVLERAAHEATSEAKEEMLLKPGTVEWAELLLKLGEKMDAEPAYQRLSSSEKMLFTSNFHRISEEALKRDVWKQEIQELTNTFEAYNPEFASQELKDAIAAESVRAHLRLLLLMDEARHNRYRKDLDRLQREADRKQREAQLDKEILQFYRQMADKEILQFYRQMALDAMKRAAEARFHARLAGSLDPNDKAANTLLFCRPAMVSGTPQCAPYFVGPENTTDPIEYVIQFENLAEATAAAQSVVITDVLDDDLDPSTLRVVTTSHPGIESNPNRFSFDVVGNVATFRWTGIDLPPNVESPEGEGYVMFTIEPRPGLASGTEIRNSASIVFDFNPPIVTPEVVHVVDTNPPVTTATPSVDPNGHGWNRTDVTVTLRGDDGANGSGVKEMHVRVDGGPEVFAGATAVVSLTDEGVHTISYFAVDNVGNTEAGRVLTVSIDKTPPVVTGARVTPPNTHGWNNGPVVVSFTASDALSGIDGPTTGDVTLSGEGAAQSARLGFTDKAGNSASATVDGINIDVTAPAVACSNSAPTLWPPNHKLVAVQATVTVTDGRSGPLGFTLLRATSNEPDNGLGDGDTADDIQGFTIGTPTSGLLRAERWSRGTGRIYSLVYQGADLAGNTATCTTPVTVPHNQGNAKR